MTSAPITTADMLEFCRIRADHDRCNAGLGLNLNITYGVTFERSAAIFEAILARLEQQEPPSAVCTCTVIDGMPYDIGDPCAVHGAVVAPQPEPPTEQVNAIIAIIDKNLYCGWDSLTEGFCSAKELAELILAALAPQPETPAPHPFTMTIAPVVSVEALLALPRYTARMTQDGYHIEPEPLGYPDRRCEFVKWSDLAALWPPQTGD